jgi:hypothetical protein
MLALRSLLSPTGRHATSTVLGLALAVLLVPAAAQAQQRAAKVANTATPGGIRPYRAVAPGVEITIPPDRQEEETFSTHDLVEILVGIPGLDWTPKLYSPTETLRDMATGTVFRRSIWCLEITFKPVRMIWVDVPQSSGRMQRKLIWYMVYRVKNTGHHLQPAKSDDGSYVLEPVEREVRFFPQFVLESQEYNRAYMDRIIPVAIRAIQEKEDPSRPLLDSVEIGSRKIPLSSELVDHSVWGVATWEDVDPRVDFFSVQIQGLTNAYQWVDAPGAFKPGDPPGAGRTLLEKTLVLNFWRPGDEFVEDQRTIRFGSPGKVDYTWIYR